MEKVWQFVGDSRIVVERKSNQSRSISSSATPQLDLAISRAKLKEEKLKSFYEGSGMGMVSLGVFILFVTWFRKKKKEVPPPDKEVNLVINVSRGNFSFKVIENGDGKETLNGAGSSDGAVESRGKASDVQDVQTENSGKNPSSSKHQ